MGSHVGVEFDSVKNSNTADSEPVAGSDKNLGGEETSASEVLLVDESYGRDELADKRPEN